MRLKRASISSLLPSGTSSLIAEHPEAFPKFEREIRRAVLKQFPYGVYYVIKPSEIVVLYFIAMAQEEGSSTR